MRTIKFFFSLAAAFFVCAGLHAQVTIGGTENPKAGAILDLNSTFKGGLLLSNVDITCLDSIPAGTGYFPGVNTSALRDVNPELRGAIVYNTNETTGTGVYVWNGKWWRPAATPDNEQIAITVRTTADDTYSIPTAGYLNGTYNHAYDWDITVDGQPAGNDNGHFYGVGGGDFDGIELTLGNGDHQIRITPHGGADPGWGNAFGYCDSIKGAHTVVNKQKLISIDAPLTTMAFAPKIAEAGSTLNASYMFARLFVGCSKLTTAAVIMDTYKLPETITNLSNFLGFTHSGNSLLAAPIDLKPLKGWFNGNQKISNLATFLFYTHSGNSTLAAPIDLTSLKDWFNGNTSIKDMTYFLFATHSGNSALAKPIDLAPLSGWFKGNISINSMPSFLYGIHSGNSAFANPIDLEPLKDWFNGNNSINNLSNFLAYAYNGNTALTDPIDLEPLKDWFNSNNTIGNLGGFLYCTHSGNSALTTPIDLEPLKDWFNGNNSINNLSNFLALTHSSNTVLTAPVNLEHLKDWFPTGKSIDNLASFLDRTHQNNYGFTLPDQFIFPDWIQTMTQDDAAIWDVKNAFFLTFSLSDLRTGNTEPTFEDGSTTLSSLGNPTTVFNQTGIVNGAPVGSYNKGTYTNRGITPSNGHNSWVEYE
jgi:hypothetical protein